jgi:hypothetical protein
VPDDLEYAAAAVPIRADLREAQRALWEHLASPGTWWSGSERVAIAAEGRRAAACRLCRRRRDALSPTAVAGAHDDTGTLSRPVVDVIHRIRTDPGRLSRAWFEEATGGGLAVTHYVELVGVLALTTGLDYFARALGIPPFSWPAPRAGEPARRRPPSAREGSAWVPMIAPEDAAGAEADLYRDLPFVPNIIRALSLVPAEARALRRSSDAHYVPAPLIGDPTARRALDRTQIELVAARVSALNECFY